MQNNKEFDILVEWLRSDSICLEEIIQICAKIQAWLKAKNSLEVTVKTIFDTTWISVRNLLEQLYIESSVYADEMEYMILDISAPAFRFALLDAFTKRNDFTVIAKWNNQVITLSFSFPFDTKENIENLQRLITRVKAFPKWTLFDVVIEKKPYKWRRQLGYLYEILSNALDDFHEKVFDFCETFFMWFPEEFEAYHKGKKIKVTVKNKRGDSYSDEIFNGLDIITLYERVETIEQKFSELKQETQGEWNYEIQIVW